MTFPDRKFDTISAYAGAYFGHSRTAQDSVDVEKLDAAFQLLDAAYGRGAVLYVCGNGGSASISNHLVCDHSKCGQTDTDIRPKVVSLSTNMEMVTAIANDISYEEIFVYQLKTLAEAGDVLLTISSSGDSENVVRAAKWAKDNGLGVIAFTGFDGGRSARLADINLHVAGDNFGVIEDTHQSLMHILAQFIRHHHMDDATIPDRKF